MPKAALVLSVLCCALDDADSLELGTLALNAVEQVLAGAGYEPHAGSFPAHAPAHHRVALARVRHTVGE